MSDTTTDPFDPISPSKIISEIADLNPVQQDELAALFRKSTIGEFGTLLAIMRSLVALSGRSTPNATDNDDTCPHCGGTGEVEFQMYESGDREVQACSNCGGTGGVLEESTL